MRTVPATRIQARGPWTVSEFPTLSPELSRPLFSGSLPAALASTEFDWVRGLSHS